MDPANNVHIKVQRALELQCEMQQLMDASGEVLMSTQEDALALRTMVREFLQHYADLGKTCDADLDLLFNMTPKFHWLWHLAQSALYLSPRRGACWIDETFVGIMKVIAKSVTYGLPLHRMPHSIMTKWQYGRAAERTMRH